MAPSATVQQPEHRTRHLKWEKCPDNLSIFQGGGSRGVSAQGWEGAFSLVPFSVVNQQRFSLLPSHHFALIVQ